ncbi:hypothetical protein PG994_014726 [Apiospora phragmitis]|uniref:Cytochrome P450 n=1 Tax=Apiospora phragmitis TaxID=2905665 RepID=A0ABR1SUG8_9PEZI
MASGQGSTAGPKADDGLSSGKTKSEHIQATVDSEAHADEQAGPVGDPLPPKQPRPSYTETDTGEGDSTAYDGSPVQAKYFQATVEEEMSAIKNEETTHSPPQTKPQHRPAKKGTTHMLSESSKPKAASPSTPFSQSGTSASGRSDGNDDSCPRPATGATGPPSVGVEAGTDAEEDFDFDYDDRLERLAAEPDVLVGELRVLQKALGATLPPTRRGSVDWGIVTTAKAGVGVGVSMDGSVSPAAGAGTYGELERLRIRWAALSKRVIALSSHLDKIVQAAAEACRKSGAHPERPVLVSRLKQLVVEVQPGTAVHEQYKGLPLRQVIKEVYPQGWPEPDISSDDSSRTQQKKKSPPTFISAAAAEVLRTVPIPKSVSETTEKVILMETLSVGGAVLLGLFVAYAIWSYYSTARGRVPGVHGMGYGHAPFFASWRGAIKFMLRPRYYLLKGYKKYKSGYFTIATLRGEYILVSDKAKMSELLTAPADVLSFLDIGADEIQSKWTLGNNAPWHLGLISGRLTQNIGTLTPGLFKEINDALDKYVGSPRGEYCLSGHVFFFLYSMLNCAKDFTPITLHNVIQKVVARAVSYAFVGHPLCRDEVYLGNLRAFTRAVLVSTELIRPFPDSWKPYLIRLTPAWRRRKFAEEVMHSVVLARLRKNYKAKEAKPVDLLQWLAETAPSRERNVTKTVERLMGMNLAAIHKTSSVLTGAVIQVALTPDMYTPTLRQEILALRENGIITQKTMLNATKLDSFVREAGRMNPISMIGLMCIARKGFRSRDGTSIPKGTRLGVPTVAIHQDAAIYHKPDLFDGFRFSKLRKEHPADTTKHEAAGTGLEYLTFGHGKHVCLRVLVKATGDR